MFKDLSRRAVITKLFPAALVAMIYPSLASAEEQPRMRSAMEALRRAQSELEAASSDKGGHRARALDYVKRAIVEVDRGIAFDNSHGNDRRDDHRNDHRRH